MIIISRIMCIVFSSVACYYIIAKYKFDEAILPMCIAIAFHLIIIEIKLDSKMTDYEV